MAAPPAAQAGPSNYTTAAVTTRSQKWPTKWDITKPTPIKTNLLYNRRQCAFWKKFRHNVHSYTKKRATLNDHNNQIQPCLNNIIDTWLVPNGWEDGDKELSIALWIDYESGMKEAYQACIKVYPVWKYIYAAPEKSRKTIQHRNGFLYIHNLKKQLRLVLPTTFNVKSKNFLEIAFAEAHVTTAHGGIWKTI